MDAKITKKRLSHMLSYDWLKIIGLALAVVFFWILVFTVTATRVIPSQQFTVANYIGNTTLRTELSNSLASAHKKGIFTHEVLETNTVDLAIADRSTAYQLLEARTTTDELDLMLISQAPNTSSEPIETDSSESDQTVYSQTYLQSFLYGYYPKLHNLDPNDENGFFRQLTRYLQKYYGEDYETGSVNIALVEEDFRARIARNKDKRYKKEAQIQKGIQGEVERLEKYRAALATFFSYVDSGYVQFVETEYVPSEQNAAMGDKGWKKTYAINLCPDVTTMGNLSKIVSYTVEKKDENNKTVYENTAKDMCVALFNSNGAEECYRYEGLLYINELIKTSLTVNS